MNIVSLENITKQVEEKTLFRGVTLGVNEGEKIGFIGPNGSGKSTFLHILTGDTPYDGGTLSKRKGIHIGMLEQTPMISEGTTLKEFLFLGSSPVITLINTYYAFLGTYNHSPADEDKLAQLTTEMDNAHAWDVENGYLSLLQEFGLPGGDSVMSTLSGGMKK